MDDMPPDDGAKRRTEYWNDFYAARDSEVLPLPSQFACFVAGELDRDTTVVDIGCGAGRDSFFFASAGIRTIGVDASESAIRRCEATRTTLAVKNVSFIESRVEQPGLAQRIVNTIGAEPRCSVYARFLLHAISEEQEDELLALAATICPRGNFFAAEFRTIRDASLAKVTPEHYRRFLDPLTFLQKAHRFGFVHDYYVEGFGFAKHKNDDAYVARCLLRAPGQ